MNFLLRTDSYKVSQWKQYPPNTAKVYSYMESRGGFFSKTVFFAALNYYLSTYLAGQVFMKNDILEAEAMMEEHFGRTDVFNKQGWTTLLEKYNGELPISIKAAPEGSVIDVSNVLVTVVNTDNAFPWLTSWLETLLLKMWYPITVATLSAAVKTIIRKDLERTGTPSLLPFKLHDFGYRGVSSEEGAMLGGAAHLVNFLGTDTMAGLHLHRRWYRENRIAGFSIPAMEHSTVTSWGKEREVDSYDNMIEQYPSGMVAVVVDSYDTSSAVRNLLGNKLKGKIEQRDGMVIARPDSGKPVDVMDMVLTALADTFGWETNSKQYRVLHPKVRAIQGDGVNYWTIQDMNTQLTRKGWSMDNWGYGMGGAMLQQVNRDTQKFAFKCSALQTTDGKWRDVYKDPVTDTGKVSKRGRLALIQDNEGNYRTVPVRDGVENPDDLLIEVFRNGEILHEATLAQIRDRAKDAVIQTY